MDCKLFKKNTKHTHACVVKLKTFDCEQWKLLLELEHIETFAKNAKIYSVHDKLREHINIFILAQSSLFVRLKRFLRARNVLKVRTLLYC